MPKLLVLGNKGAQAMLYLNGNEIMGIGNVYINEVGKKVEDGGEIFSDYETNEANAIFASSFGSGNKSNGRYSFTVNRNNEAGDYSFVGGSGNKGGYGTHVVGATNDIQGKWGNGEGLKNKATDKAIAGHVEGSENELLKQFGHIEGYNNRLGYKAVDENDTSPLLADDEGGVSGHVEGSSNIVEANWGHAEGGGNIVRGKGAHAQNGFNEANGDYSHAQNDHCIANHYGSSAGGEHTITGCAYQTVIGSFNEGRDDTAFEVGNGGYGANRQNAFAVYKDGSIDVGGVKITPEQLTKLLALIS